MPRRVVASATPNRASSNVSFRDTPVLPPPDGDYTDNITLLRKHWKWAAFSQFFYTFAQLLQMPDVSITVRVFFAAFFRDFLCAPPKVGGTECQMLTCTPLDRTSRTTLHGARVCTSPGSCSGCCIPSRRTEK